MSNLRPQAGKNTGDNVFGSTPAGTNEPTLLASFLDAHDFSPNTRRAFRTDIRKFASWFATSNGERFIVERVTTRDVQDFRDDLRKKQGQAVATVNRALVALRRFFTWLVEQGHAAANPAKNVKELRQQHLAAKGLDRKHIRKLLREVELREDVRANAIFHLFLFTGCRCGDAVQLELTDVVIGERSGQVTFRMGKGRKQRSVPLPIQARRALQTYLTVRPPVPSERLFIGERGPLTDRGIRNLCDKYSAIVGVKIYPHLLRHSMAHQFLKDNQNDLVSLAQILGHENLNTTARYTQRTTEELAETSERLHY